MQSEQLQPDNKKYTWILLGLVLFVITLSIAVFSHQSLRLDEAQSLWQTSHTPTKILNILAQDVHVPLYHMILHFWQLFLGSTVTTGRMLSLIFFALSIPAMYYLGKRMFGPSTAIFATALLAISPFMNWYGNEMRMYSLFTLLTILSQYFFVGIFRRQDSDSWIGYFLVGLFGIFAHYFFWFVLLVQAIFYFLYKDLFPAGSLKRLIIIAVTLVLVFSPWVYYVQTLGTVNNQAPVLSIPTTVNVFNTFSQFIFGFQNDHLNTVLVSLWPITVLLGFLALRENKRVSPEVIYVIMSILIPITMAFIVSVTLRPLFVSRYLI
ncbi:MAG: glycosyltransferase family 39 protein, partial [bacterium]|nr:glycosyltransferase family 39 protein [bacterium]